MGPVYTVMGISELTGPRREAEEAKRRAEKLGREEFRIRQGLEKVLLELPRCCKNKSDSVVEFGQFATSEVDLFQRLHRKYGPAPIPTATFLRYYCGGDESVRLEAEEVIGMMGCVASISDVDLVCICRYMAEHSKLADRLNYLAAHGKPLLLFQ
jgi:hypothetical protein